MVKYHIFKNNAMSIYRNECELPELRFSLLGIENSSQLKALKECIEVLSKVGQKYNFKRLRLSGTYRSQSLASVVELTIKEPPLAYIDTTDFYDINLDKRYSECQPQRIMALVENKDEIECPICHKKLKRNKRLIVDGRGRLVGLNCYLEKVASPQMIREFYCLRKFHEQLSAKQMLFYATYYENHAQIDDERNALRNYIRSIDTYLKECLFEKYALPQINIKLTSADERKLYSAVMKYTLYALLNRILSNKPFSVKDSYSKEFYVDNEQGKVLLFMRSLYNGYLSKLSSNVVANLLTQVTEQFNKERLETKVSLKDKYFVGDFGYDCNLPKFYYVLEETDKTVKVVECEDKCVGGTTFNDISYAVVPVKKFVGKPMRKKRYISSRNGKPYIMISHTCLTIWDGEPQIGNQR